MKISEVIKELEKIKAEKGDVLVTYHWNVDDPVCCDSEGLELYDQTATVGSVVFNDAGEAELR